MDNDSTLVSVELDDSLQSVARDALAGDERVTWVLGDGSDWLRAAVERPERYDLVFADTWPGKYHDRELAMELVAPGGWYVIDDLHPQPGWPEGRQATVDRLLAEMEQVDGWRTEFLPWGSGSCSACGGSDHRVGWTHPRVREEHRPRRHRSVGRRGSSPREPVPRSERGHPSPVLTTRM